MDAGYAHDQSNRENLCYLPNIIDKKSSSVRQLIIRVSDQLKAVEIRLIDWTPEETKEAKARLDAQRKKRRERHTKIKIRQTLKAGKSIPVRKPY